MHRKTTGWGAACVALSGLLVHAGGCAVTMLNAEDIIITGPAARETSVRAEASDTCVRLPAYLERRVVLSTVGVLPDVPVEFYRDGDLLGSALTDDRGCATIDCDGPAKPWRYCALAALPDGDLEAQGVVWHLPADRPVVVIDMDETLLQSRYLSMLFWIQDPSPPMAYAQEAVTAMSRDYQIIYISTRARLFRDMTRAWLEKHDFPPAPIVHACDFSAVFDQRQAKVEMVRSLKQRGVRIVAGVGDKELDEFAYDANGIPAIIIRPGYRPKHEGTIALPDWADVPASLQNRIAPQTTPTVRLRITQISDHQST